MLQEWLLNRFNRSVVVAQLKTLSLLLSLFVSFAFPAFAQTSSVMSLTADASQHGKKIVGYFPQWGIYSNFFLKNVVTSGSAPLLTHLNYAFANVVTNQCQGFDPWADFQVPFPANETVNGKADSKKAGAFVGNFHQLRELKRLYPELKIIMSIGGASADPKAFSLAAEPQNRAAFVASCIDMYIDGNFAPGLHEPGIFDGFDIDWEFPGPADKQNLTGLLREFRQQLNAKRRGLVLTLIGPAGSQNYDNIELNKVQSSIDFFNMETYDYDGPWSNMTGFVAPLYKAHRDPDPTNNANFTIRFYLHSGVEPEKMVFGIPFYGYEWTDVPDIDHGLFDQGTPVGQGSPYNYIVTIEHKFTKYRNLTTEAPWLYDGQTFWTYDDPVAIRFKMDYVREHDLGGAMVWELSNDLSDGRLLKTIAHGLRQDEQGSAH
jgi:chitinase